MTDERIAIDADGHVLESDELFTEYLDPEFRDRTKGWALNDDNNRRFIVDGICHPPHPPEISSRKPMTAENRVKVLDKERIQAAVLFPSANTIATYLDPEFADAMVRAHNSWIADYVKPYPDRLFFAAPVSIDDVGAAIAEAQRAVNDLGAVAILDFPVKTERECDRVVMTRLMPDVPPPPLYKEAGGFAGNVDRWQIVETILPCCTDVDVSCAETGSGVLQGDRQQGVSFHAANVPTPETETTCHFFYGHARCFQTDSEAMDEVYRRDFYRVFMEDVVIMEAQQTSMDLAPDKKWVDINVDAPGIAMRNLLRDRVMAEVAS